MNDSVTRPPIKQARAAKKREQILAATEDLLSEVPPSEVTTRMVAERAGIPIGSVYRYFANVEGLLHSLFESFNERTVEAVRALPVTPSNWRHDLRRILAIVKDAHDEHPAYGALMGHVGRLEDESSAINSVLSDRILKVAENLDEEAAANIAGMVITIVEAVERRYESLPPDQRGTAFEEGEKALEAYLALYLDP
ncbi:TetR/AcrR family transcriptional regulator [Parvularcula lutaonensis]|uniref:TetR/AcrR family transcriptional regulator n=1 Tax=Parvularcula lutaonensis TaxID=491923 RepID=A0ABV7MB63_9PROT|nr:TetR/AcrR family transcriptional regulator [Parvularcula lutaonensis]GGY37929.1 hypothetical protein GCM10007148_02750 [Parvularcula lutaonensis]